MTPPPLRGAERARAAHELAAAFQTGTGIPALAEESGRSPTLVRRLLEEAGVVAPAWPACLGLPEDRLAAVLADRYQRGRSMQALAEESGIDRRTIRRLLERADAAPAPRSTAATLTTTDLIHLYQAGSSLRGLAERSGMSYAKVRETLLAAGITLRGRGNPTGRADQDQA
ncbi:helix-turn-helix domain-containing protein [Actinokineospora inagensis]|uniref:helix-turn-helix domain-containing protein n=1 Tax=Actinokineospora inagensis TaxID=103730 RepID=UPI00042A1976|nr:helix-turn-helix domain-containing protein [Actinokineospora inagensis]